MKVRYNGHMKAPWRLGQNRTLSPDNKALMGAHYRFPRGEWVEVLDGDASEFREMARKQPETWETDEGPFSKGRTGSKIGVFQKSPIDLAVQETRKRLNDQRAKIEKI